MTTGRDRKGRVQGICKREDKGVACKPRKFRKFNVGRGIGGAWAVAEWHSQEHEPVSVCQNQYQMLFLTAAKSRVPSSLQLWLAHNIILCSPVAGGDRGGAGVKITLIVHISFCFATQVWCGHFSGSEPCYIISIWWLQPQWHNSNAKFPPFALLPPDFERSVLKSFAAIQRTWMKYCCSRHRKNVPLTLDNPLNTLLTSEKRLTLLCGLSRLTLFSVGDSASRFFKIDIFNSLRKHRWHESLCTGVWTKYVLYILKLMHINSKLSAC